MSGSADIDLEALRSTAEKNTQSDDLGQGRAQPGELARALLRGLTGDAPAGEKRSD